MYYEAFLFATGMDSLHGLRILDIGCGSGSCLEFVARNFNPHRAIGIDTENQFVTASDCDHPSNLTFIQSNLNNIAFSLSG